MRESKICNGVTRYLGLRIEMVGFLNVLDLISNNPNLRIGT